MITSCTARVSEATQHFVDISTPEGQRSGLRQNSAVICTNLFTIEKRLVLQRIGFLSGNDMSQIDACLEAALGLPSGSASPGFP
jgi:mRNA interferase MazF